MCRDLKCNRSNNKVLAWLITGAAADSWRTADIPSPNFVLIPITQCKVVAWPFFTKSAPPLPCLGLPQHLCLPALRKRLISGCAGAFIAVSHLSDLWLIVGKGVKLEMLFALIVLLKTCTVFITKVRLPCSFIQGYVWNAFPSSFQL